MGRINLKTDYEDGNILHGSELNINNNVTMLGVNDNFDQITKLKLSKADLTYVDNSLSTKADLATLNTKIQEIDLLKANKSELATKANQSDLDKKANKTYVDEQLELKANQTQVYNELQKKVDKDIYEEAISNKVDSETVGDLRELKTDDKSSIVRAINSINTEAKSIATVDKVGVVKPDGTTITIDQDGTIHSLGGGGGTGGTTDYNDLANKPQINNVEIKGNLSLEELGLMSSIDTENALAKKANSSDVYNKEHIDIIESQLADKANTADVNSKLETKANIEDVYNKTTVNELFVAEAAKTDAKLLNKADSDNVYSKSIVDEKISKKADNIDFNNESKQLQLTSNGSLIGDPVTLEVTGNEVIIGNVQPSEKDDNWKIWINSDEVQNLGSEVVDTLDGNETDKSPSVRAVKEELNVYSTKERVIGIWENEDGTKQPLYEKTIKGTINESGSGTYPYFATGISNIKYFMIKNCTVVYGGYRYYTDNSKVNGYYDKTNNVIQFNQPETTGNVTIIANYTKTTDTPVSTLSEVTE